MIDNCVDFKSAKSAVIDYCHANFHPIHVDNKEKVASYNKKVKEESRITSLPLDAVYACRYFQISL